MDRLDFSPLFRSTIGFDRLTRLVDAATRVDSAALAYPPYNIEKTGGRRLSADDGRGRVLAGRARHHRSGEHSPRSGQGTEGGRERQRLFAPRDRPAQLRTNGALALPTT
jgi:hypothetical protein